MTPQRKFALLKLGCCVSIFSAIIATELTDSDAIAAVGIVIVFLSLCTFRLIFEQERKLLDAEREILFDQFMARFRADVEQCQSMSVRGDQTCLHNARSPYLQCAMHPKRLCSECPDYTSIYFDAPQNQKETPSLQSSDRGAV